MQDVVDLGHFDSASHELITLVDKLVLGHCTLLAILVRIRDSLNVCFNLTLQDSAHLVGNRVAVFDLAVNDSCGLLQSS